VRSVFGLNISNWKTSPVGRFIQKYQADDADTLAAMIAFSAVFSLFPLLIGALTFLGLVLNDPARLAALTNAIEQRFPEGVSELLTFLQETRQISGVLGIISFLGLLWSGAALIGSMARAFNRFYGVPERSFLRQKLMEVLVIVAFLALIVLAVAGSSVMAILSELGAEYLPSGPAAMILSVGLGQLVSVLSAVALFLLIYRVVPNAPIRWRDTLRGAVISVILFAIILQMFPLYIKLLGGGFAAYKTLGLLPLLLTWFYLLARIIVLGAALNAFWHPVAAPAQVIATSLVARARQQRAVGETHGSQSGPATVAGIRLILALVWRFLRRAA
jgi:membrane protein